VKYISFDPWPSGLSNTRMSYELAAAISVISGRTLILPPKIFLDYISTFGKKKTFFNIWTIYDLELFKSQFNCVHYEDIPEYRELENTKQYFYNVEKIAKNILFTSRYVEYGGMDCPAIEQVIVNDILDENDFNSFGSGREIININCEDEFIHFPRNLFGHFYYHVYAQSPALRNALKEKIRDGFKFRKEYFDISENIQNKLGKYNSLHIRRCNAFVLQRSAESQVQSLYEDIKDRVPLDMPLYIATDAPNASIFRDFKKHYRNLYFLDSFVYKLKNYEKAVVDQIMCAGSEIFLGSKFSTYSDSIHILRGYAGKLDFHREGTNFKLPQLSYTKFPWEVETYGWENIQSFQWQPEAEPSV